MEQEGAEGVVVAVVVTQEAAFGQADRHFVSSRQLQRHDNGGAVLLVVRVEVFGCCHCFAIDLQTGAYRQRETGRAGVTVGGDGQAVDAREGDGEESGFRAVGRAKVKEDIFVDDDAVGGKRPETSEIISSVQSSSEGGAFSWKTEKTRLENSCLTISGQFVQTHL